MRPHLSVLLKGAAMGVAEVIPGVSGGTIALITGIYDRLVGAIAALHPRPLRHLPRVHHASARRSFVDELRAMDVPFLLTLGVGMATMVILLARVVERLFETAPGITYAFFAGLIAASAVVLYGEVAVDTWGRRTLAVVTATLAFVLSGLAAGNLGHALPVIFLAGAIAITAMVLPGVSGSFLLLALGQYEYMIGLLNAFIDALLGLIGGGSTLGDLAETAVPVGAFLVGAALGLLTIAHVVDYALERARELTLIALISLMVGSLRVPGQEVLARLDTTPTWLASVALAAGLGIAAIVLLDHYTDDLTY